ncbi:RNA-binding protein 45-like [Anneissia japonica]|uniref:RNA-binding protein 45-like n=1 Tax=Anneissia japonica TaxID=1529436 RepID=UPI001425697C|nr:RNA-binding protein 45-like [Anneissia japonica]
MAYSNDGGPWAGDKGRDSFTYDYGHGGRVGGGNAAKMRNDLPPNSRIFIVCGKNQDEDSLRSHFDKYGAIEDVYVVKDRVTKQNKGVAYIKYSKASEACLALEGLDGRSIGNDPRPLKVMIANSRYSTTHRDIDEQEELMRLFIIVPKTYTEEQVEKNFESYGDIDRVTLVKDRHTGDPKGFAYVKFRKASAAAIAMENCEKSFKAIYAQPKHSKAAPSSAGRDSYSMSSFFDGGRRDHYSTSMGSSSEPYGSASSKLHVWVDISVTQDQLRRLFDLVPGMDYCDLRQETTERGRKGFAHVRYGTSSSAMYAKQKLDGFEYPPGCPMTVRLEDEPARGFQSGYDYRGMSSPEGIVRQGFGGEGSPTCSVPLPSTQPLLAHDCEVTQRLFIVCNPRGVPDYILKDVFCRFGNLIDCYMLPGRNYGYAKYANRDSALEAVKILHGQELAGQRLKVMEADPNEEQRKRPRVN